MNYYNEIKNEILNNEITKRVKNYSKNKYIEIALVGWKWINHILG